MLATQRTDRAETPPDWPAEIELAIAYVRKTKPFGWMMLHRITDANLFHLAPLVSVKFRGRKLSLFEDDDETDPEEVEDMRKDDIRQCTRDLLLIERAREWLLEEEEE